MIVNGKLSFGVHGPGHNLKAGQACKAKGLAQRLQLSILEAASWLHRDMPVSKLLTISKLVAHFPVVHINRRLIAPHLAVRIRVEGPGFEFKGVTVVGPGNKDSRAESDQLAKFGGYKSHRFGIYALNSNNSWLNLVER